MLCREMKREIVFRRIRNEKCLTERCWIKKFPLEKYIGGKGLGEMLGNECCVQNSEERNAGFKKTAKENAARRNADEINVGYPFRNHKCCEENAQQQLSWMKFTGQSDLRMRNDCKRNQHTWA